MKQKKRRTRKVRIEERGSRRRVFLYAILIAAMATLLSPVGYVAFRSPDLKALREENPRSTALMRERAEEAMDEGRSFHKNQTWVPLGRISPHLVRAVIVSEDATFYEHHGFDRHELSESIRKNWRERRFARGASTISQQLTKNLYYGTDKSLRRKFLEAITTWRMERTLSKDRILEIYLNVIEWGRGVYGAEAAARHHFGVAASDLTPRQAALLASCIPNPRKMNPARPGPFLTKQANLTLKRMEARKDL